jgi:RHS repeat-associated protein
MRPTTRTLLIAALLAASVANAAATTTTTTKYQYNADGGLTAITKQAADGTTTTTYLVWDDFTPNASDPTTGTVSAANGRLVGFGSSPDDLTTTFQFDVRDRLKSFSGGAQSETYDYHANGTMASSSTAGDALQFYYDKSKNAQCTNIYQTGQSLWSGYLGHVRYLNDGSEQVLMKPRKDMAALYNAGQQTLAPYTYDAYGSQPNATPQTGYDLHDNPFQYTGEYRDPLWGGYYLRARWYDPDLPVFLSRDPEDNLNRYGYAGGNAVMNIDPSGRNFLHALGAISKEAGKLNALLNKGWYGHLDRFFLAPVLSALQLVANPKGFWQAIKTDKDGIDLFMAAGAVNLYAWDWIGTWATLSRSTLYLGCQASGLGISVGGVVAASADRGFKHFNWTTFTNGLEMTGGSFFYYNLVGGFRYRHRFDLEANQIKGLSNQLQAEESDDALIIRRRIRTKALGIPMPKNTGPLQEALGMGTYHEQLIAITRDNVFTTEVLDGEVVAREFENTPAVLNRVLGKPGALSQATGYARDFELVGVHEGFMHSGFYNGFEGVSPLNIRLEGEGGATRYSWFRNDSMLHARAMLQMLGMQ